MRDAGVTKPIDRTAKRPTVAAVVPAHNEAPRILAVLEPLAACDVVDEIIVVDDSSDDNTSLVAASIECVRVVSTPRNLGKGGALATGIVATKADIVCTIDADLLGLSATHIQDLVEPLWRDSEVAMTVGRFIGGRKRTDWAQSLVKSISGQRAMHRSFVESLPDFAGSRFGVETLITKHAEATGAKVVVVAMEGVTQVMKEEKLGVGEGMKERLKMYADIAEHRLPIPVRRSPRKKTKRHPS